MEAYIYTIRTLDGLYVGSTYDFNKRCIHHKSNVKIKDTLLYNNIIKNNYQYDINIYKKIIVKDFEELRMNERIICDLLKANLNTTRAYTTLEEKRDQRREASRRCEIKRREMKYTCECGSIISVVARKSHNKTKKHINFYS